MRPLNQDFGRVEFAGEYPIGLVRYKADGFPIEVEMEAFSPFIPLNAKDSALPATIFHITLKNTSDEVQRVGVLGWLENAVCFDSAKAMHAVATQPDRQRERPHVDRPHGQGDAERAGRRSPGPRSSWRISKATATATGQATGEAFGKGPAHGTLPNQQTVSGFLGKGLVNTFLGGDRPQGTLTSPAFEVSRKYLNFLIGGGSHAGQTCINLLIDGKAVRTATGKDNEKLEWHFWNVEDLQGKTARIEIVDRNSGGWGHINIDQIELADESLRRQPGPVRQAARLRFAGARLGGRGVSAKNTREIVESTAGWSKLLHATIDVTYPVTERRSEAMATKMVKLAPRASRTFTFVLAWFFPNHPQGHEYDSRFADATKVAQYVLDNHDRLAGDTKKWHQTFYEDSTLPRWLLFRLHSTVSTLATGTCQWWQQRPVLGLGRRRLLRGDLHARLELRPRAGPAVPRAGTQRPRDAGLRRGLRRQQRPRRLPEQPHAMRRTASAARSSRPIASTCARRTTRSCKRNWPRIKKALEFSIKQDGNDDGLIENSQHNTYDINFEGPNTFVGSLYLAALRAGEEMAREMDDEDFAERCEKIFESGVDLTMERLWDGEYFIQIVDLKKHPKDQYGKGCLSDQLFGQGWAHQLALGYIYPPEQVKQALRQHLEVQLGAGHRPVQRGPSAGAMVRPAGRGGTVHLHLAQEPVPERRRALPGRGLDGHRVPGRRPHGLGGHGHRGPGHLPRRPGPLPARQAQPVQRDRVRRPLCPGMASWGVYTALAGFEYHGPNGTHRLCAAHHAGEFPGRVHRGRRLGLLRPDPDADVQREQIDLRWGRLKLKSLAFAVPQDWKTVKMATSRRRQVLINSRHHRAGDGRAWKSSSRTPCDCRKDRDHRD